MGYLNKKKTALSKEWFWALVNYLDKKLEKYSSRWWPRKGILIVFDDFIDDDRDIAKKYKDSIRRLWEEKYKKHWEGIMVKWVSSRLANDVGYEFEYKRLSDIIIEKVKTISKNYKRVKEAKEHFLYHKNKKNEKNTSSIINTQGFRKGY